MRTLVLILAMFVPSVVLADSDQAYRQAMATLMMRNGAREVTFTRDDAPNAWRRGTIATVSADPANACRIEMKFSMHERGPDTQVETFGWSIDASALTLVHRDGLRVALQDRSMGEWEHASLHFSDENKALAVETQLTELARMCGAALPANLPLYYLHNINSLLQRGGALRVGSLRWPDPRLELDPADPCRLVVRSAIGLSETARIPLYSRGMTGINSTRELRFPATDPGQADPILVLGSQATYEAAWRNFVQLDAWCRQR